ncbi:hypothetical protein G6F65_021601 [Rhizopus arrhizus]|nr:hypothetical protein G6F65_021601 [Rhizopus arrhizus]
MVRNTRPRAFGPRHAGIPAAAGRWNRRQHAAVLRIHLLDAPVGDLIEILAVKGRAGAGRDVQRARGFAATGIQRDELLTCREPDLLAIERDAMHVVDAGERAVFTEDFGLGSFHDRILFRWRSHATHRAAMPGVTSLS